MACKIFQTADLSLDTGNPPLAALPHRRFSWGLLMLAAWWRGFMARRYGMILCYGMIPIWFMAIRSCIRPVGSMWGNFGPIL